MKAQQWVFGIASVAVLAIGATQAYGQCTFGWRPGTPRQIPPILGRTYSLAAWDQDGPGPQPEVLAIGGGDPFSLAFWSQSGWEVLSENLDGPVLALTVLENDLIVGGQFLSAGSTLVNRIARWDGTSWQPLGTGMSGPVYALTVYNGELIAGGWFTTASGVSANRIARWDGTSWQPLGTGMEGGKSPGVIAFSEFNGELIVGGRFATAGGYPSAYWARWGPNCPRGDMNCNQVVDIDDVPLFVEALLDPDALDTCRAYTANTNADVHADGTPRIDGLDVQGFVGLLVP